MALPYCQSSMQAVGVSCISGTQPLHEPNIYDGMHIPIIEQMCNEGNGGNVCSSNKHLHTSHVRVYLCVYCSALLVRVHMNRFEPD
jgi:hypothetical protein